MNAVNGTLATPPPFNKPDILGIEDFLGNPQFDTAQFAMATKPGILIEGSGPVALGAGEVYNVSSASMYAQGFETHGNTATDMEYMENGSMYGVLGSMSGTLPGYIVPESPAPTVPAALTFHLSKIVGTYGYSNVSARDAGGDTSFINSVFSADPSVPGNYGGIRTNFDLGNPNIPNIPVTIAGQDSTGRFVFSSDSRDNQGGLSGTVSYLTEAGNSKGDYAAVTGKVDTTIFPFSTVTPSGHGAGFA